MKTRILAGLVASIALLVAVSADAAPKKKGHKGPTRPASVVTTTDKPQKESGAKPKRVGSHSASPKQQKLSRFLASGVPLAEVRDGRIGSVATGKHPCGSRTQWAKVGSLWAPLDAWGQVVAQTESTIVDRRLYEGSGCHQVTLQNAKDATETPRLFVAKGAGYIPAPSAKWSPANDVVKRFEHLYASQATAWVDGKADSTADHGKVLFFNLPKQEGSVEGAPTQRRPTHWAVTGGRVLVVAYVGATGAWKVGHVLPPNGKDHAYEPLAVLDMNGDGMPEIVVHEESGGVFADRVLSFDAGTMRWEKAVESPGGATP